MSSTEVPTEYVEQLLGGCHGGGLQEYFRPAGQSWMRVDTGWQNQQPAPDADYDFSEYESLVERAREHDVRVLPILDYCAPWASAAPETADYRRDHAPVREDMTDAWADYVEAFVENFPDIEYFELWNEPNISHFLHTDEPRHEMYVERILEPAAEVIHAHDRKVVAPSFTTEWPEKPEGWPAKPVSWSVEANVESIDRWLSYRDAWKHVDYLSVHYVKGDTKKHELPYADDMMPYYDWVKANYVDTGKIDGIWNTEEGLTATEALDSGFVAMEPWEREPYPQWAPRYVVPVVNWALQNGWESDDQYKVFWYAMGTGGGTLSPSHPVEEDEDGNVRISPMGEALGTTMDLLTAGERIAVHAEGADVGFGLFSAQDPTSVPDEGNRSYDFTSYAFDVDDSVLLAAWLDLPGIKLAEDNPEQSTIQAIVPGVDDVESVVSVDYRTGEETAAVDYGHHDNGDLWARVPRTENPVLWVRVDRA